MSNAMAAVVALAVASMPRSRGYRDSGLYRAGGRPVQTPVDLGGHRLRTSRKVRNQRRAKLLNWKGGR